MSVIFVLHCLLKIFNKIPRFARQAILYTSNTLSRFARQVQIHAALARWA